MENNNVKIVIIIALVLIIIGLATFGIIKMFNKNGDKSYTLETIAEEDYKYFAVYTGGKYGVINTNRRHDNR